MMGASDELAVSGAGDRSGSFGYDVHETVAGLHENVALGRHVYLLWPEPERLDAGLEAHRRQCRLCSMVRVGNSPHCHSGGGVVERTTQCLEGDFTAADHYRRHRFAYER